MTKLALNRVIAQDKVTLDRKLFDQLVGMLEELSSIRYRTADNERCIKELNNDLSLLRRSLNL